MTAFTDTERDSIAHHLRVAATRYDENAQALREMAPGGSATSPVKRLERQMEAQAAEAREFADRIER